MFKRIKKHKGLVFIKFKPISQIYQFKIALMLKSYYVVVNR
jgi:hypothetical protein